MTLAQGDPFVVGDIFSFQQAERMKDNWRAAAEPSNPQAGSLWSDSVNEKLFHRQAAAYKEILQVETQIDGYVDLVRLSTLAAGGFGLRIDAYQDDTTGLTGLLRGAYIQASNGDIISTGTIRALELKARAGRPSEVGNDVAVLEGLSISADAKVYDITTVMRGAEIILDGALGASIVKAVGLRIAQNFQADIATLCYGLEFYRDSFENDADIALSSGGLIGGSEGHLKIDNSGNISHTLVKKEIVFSLWGIGKGATAPTLTRDNNTIGYAFAINDDGYMTFELPLDWKAGTDINITLHVYTDDVANDEIRFEATWSAIPIGEAIDGAVHAGSLDSGDQTLPALAKANQEIILGAISGSSLTPHDVMCLLIKRTALVGGTNPANDPVIFAVEYEYESNIFGEEI